MRYFVIEGHALHRKSVCQCQPLARIEKVVLCVRMKEETPS